MTHTFSTGATQTGLGQTNGTINLPRGVIVGVLLELTASTIVDNDSATAMVGFDVTNTQAPDTLAILTRYLRTAGAAYMSFRGDTIWVPVLYPLAGPTVIKCSCAVSGTGTWASWTIVYLDY